MSFQPVTWPWGGKNYSIPADQVLRPIAAVEEIVTIREVAEMVSSQKIKFVKLAEAVACVLRYSGAAVTDHEVYAHFMREGGKHVAEGHEWAYRLLSLMGLLNAPEHLREGEPAGKPAATAEPAGSSPASTSSSSA